MNYNTPPPPPSKAEIEKRVKNGAKTIAEIDPEFYKWYNNKLKYRALKMIIIALVYVVTLYACKNLILAG